MVQFLPEALWRIAMLSERMLKRLALTTTHDSLAETAARPATIVCIHGLFGGRWYFGDWLARVKAAGLGALALDLSGHHSSALPHGQTLGTLTLADYAADVGHVRAALSHLRARRVVLLGHSMGGLVAQLSAARDAPKTKAS